MLVIEFPGGGSKMLQQRALVGERKVEAEVAAVLPESHLPQKFCTAGALYSVLCFPLLHLISKQPLSLGLGA